MLTLRYGQASEIRLELPPEARLGPARDGDDRSLSDPIAAARLALQQPLGFPPLRQATVPGDQIVLAIEPGTPHAAALVAAVLEEVLPAGGEPRGITILRAQADAGLPDPRSLLSAEIAAAVQLAVHRPDDRGQLGYIGLTRGQQGVYLNRALCDADLVVPIGRTHGDQKGVAGLTGGLYPTFSDIQALAGTVLGGSAPRPRREASKPTSQVNADEIAWMLGVQCLVLAVPGADGGLCAVLAGTLEQLRQQAPARHAAAWERHVEDKTDLVVAAVTGGPAEQTWETLSRALAAASSLVAEGGSIAMCCDLETPPSEALQLVSQADDPHDMLRKLRRAASPDLAVAARLVQVRESARVYLLSRLDDATVEELGLAAAADADDIARLVTRSRTSVVLADAQHVIGITN